MFRVYWDTMLFAYWIEGNPDYLWRVRAVREGMERRQHTLCASNATVCELMVAYSRRQDTAGAERLQAFFASPAVAVLPLTAGAAPHYGALRAQRTIRPYDALHLAIAAAHEVELFLTNDRQLQKLHVPGIGFIAGLDSGLY